MASTREQLFEAIEADHVEVVRRLVTDDPSLANARDDHGVSALMRALYRMNVALVDAVEGRVDELDVFEAASFGDLDRLTTLLDAEPALVTSYSPDGFTPLHFAAFFGRPEAAALLLARGAAVDAFGRGWMTGTALHSAAANGDPASVELLLDAGADPAASNEEGRTVLQMAEEKGDRATIERIRAALQAAP
ncbi:MAG TPA: ankyrin repeat domain-containing protein [Actinomycetota bacterium]|nr:ankyrin repeat domain-containing protein [Actinomycetota bacterium]